MAALDPLTCRSRSRLPIRTARYPNEVNDAARREALPSSPIVPPLPPFEGSPPPFVIWPSALLTVRGLGERVHRAQSRLVLHGHGPSRHIGLKSMALNRNVERIRTQNESERWIAFAP